MFDLFRSRDKAIRILLGAMLVLVALSMLTYLIPSYDTGNGSSDQVVAQVGKERIMLTDVQKTIQNTVRGRQLPAEIIPNYVPQIVESMITDRALEYEAERLGYQVTDQDLRDAIRQTIPQLFPDGHFVGKDAYASLLAQQNVSIPEFESDLRRQLLVTRLRDIAIEGTVVTPAEIEAEYKKKYEKIKVQWTLLKPDMYTKEVQPTEQDIEQYYKANKASYNTPESKNLIILIADQAQLAASIPVSDAELQALYNQNKAQYRTPERVKVRHILLKTTDKPASEEPKIKAKAEDLLKQIKAGANFADLAKKYSEDNGPGGSAANGGELPDWVSRNGQTVPEFERAAMALKPGQTSDLVKTTYGYHIIQCLQHEDAHLRTFDEVKGELMAQVKKQRASQEMQDIADRAQTELQHDPAHPEKVAAEFHMDLVHADGVQPGKPVPQIGTVADFDQSLAGLKKGEVSPAVALPSDRVALALVADVIPPRPSTLSEVHDQIKDTLVQNRLTIAVQKHAQELIDKTKSMGGDLEKAAKSMGLTVSTSDEVDRNGTVQGLGTATYLVSAFDKPDGFIFGPSNAGDGTLVGKVIERVAPDMSKLAQERNTIRDQIKGEKARDRATLFEAGLRETLTKQGVIKVHQNAISSLIAQYRAS
jgi:peptidyl-prolyl cis-trans isomerase D